MAGCVVLILMGATHLAAHFAGLPTPRDSDEATLLRLMREYHDPDHGRTTLEILQGFSLFFTAASWTIAALTLVLWRSLRDQPGAVLRRTALVLVGACAAFTVTSIVYWIWPPTAFLGVATAFFAISAFRDG